MVLEINAWLAEETSNMNIYQPLIINMFLCCIGLRLFRINFIGKISWFLMFTFPWEQVGNLIWTRKAIIVYKENK